MTEIPDEPFDQFAPPESEVPSVAEVPPVAEVLPVAEIPPASEAAGLSRRRFLRQASLVVGGAAVLGGGLDLAARPVYTWFKKREGRPEAQDMFNNALVDSHKLAIFDGLLQIDPSVRVSSSIFGDVESQPDWPVDQGFVVAVRPMNVRSTLLANVADAGQGTQDDVDRVLPDIPPSLLAFYQPGPGELVYCDVDANKGLVLPLNTPDEGYPLPVTDIKIDGREIRGDVVYPYTKELYVNFQPNNQEEAIMKAAGQYTPAYYKELRKAQADSQDYKAAEQYSFIGQSIIAATVDELNSIGVNSIAFPAP